MPANHANRLSLWADQIAGAAVLKAEGVLDTVSYLALRDSIIKAALDNPRAVIVDVTDLSVPAPSAWAVFTSARWHICQWPDVPMALVCSHSAGRADIARNGITRYLPVYDSTADAVAALSEWRVDALRRRARFTLTRSDDAVAQSRELVTLWLIAWSHKELISVAKLIVTVFVENVLVHTDSAPVLRMESKDHHVTIAVEDSSAAPPNRRESLMGHINDVSGLAIVTAICRKWGSAPTPSGKTVWATIGPEDCLGGE